MVNETIELIPNYKRIFEMFLQDFTLHVQNLSHFDLEAHEYYHAIIAALNVAAQSISSAEDIQKFRAALLEAVERSTEQMAEKAIQESKRHLDSLDRLRKA